MFRKIGTSRGWITNVSAESETADMPNPHAFSVFSDNNASLRRPAEFSVAIKTVRVNRAISGVWHGRSVVKIAIAGKITQNPGSVPAGIVEAVGPELKITA